MRRKNRLSPKRQALVEQWMFLAPMIATAFARHYGPSCDRAELESEGYLAMCQAAQRYDFEGKRRNSKGYFAIAIVARIYDIFKKAKGEAMDPATLTELMESYDELDHLGMAIKELPSARDRRIADDRFQREMTIQEVARAHGLTLYEAKARCRALATHLAGLLGSHVPPPSKEPDTPLG